MLDRDGHPHLLTPRIAAVIVIAGTLCLVASGASAAGQAVVPDVVGLDALSAYDALHEAGFAVQIDEPVDVTPNHMPLVSHQSRAAGTAGHTGTPVALEFGGGTHGLLPPGGTRRVPRLVGKPLHDAVHTLEALGLLWSAAPLPPLPATMRPSLLDNYWVTEQNPKPGTSFTQTITQEIPGGLRTETSTVGLMTKVRPN